jgi:hypothetical protein
MAIQTRYAGDANGVVNVDSGIGSLGYPVATGLTKEPILVKIAGVTFTAGEMNTGGAVETILRAVEQDSTVTLYQVDSTQISVYLEATGAGGANGDTLQGAAIVTSADVATALQTRLTALSSGGNIGIAGTVTAANLTVTSSGFKLA